MLTNIDISKLTSGVKFFLQTEKLLLCEVSEVLMGYDFKVSPTTQIIETEINFNNKTVDLPGKYKFIDIKYKFLSSNHTLDSNSPRLNVDVIRNAIGQDSKVIILTTNSRYYVYLTDVSISDLYKTKMSNSLNGIVPTQDDIIGGCLRLSFSDKFLSSR